MATMPAGAPPRLSLAHLSVFPYLLPLQKIIQLQLHDQKDSPCNGVSHHAGGRIQQYCLLAAACCMHDSPAFTT
jgi:hypothetical protein